MLKYKKVIEECEPSIHDIVVSEILVDGHTPDELTLDTAQSGFITIKSKDGIFAETNLADYVTEVETRKHSPRQRAQYAQRRGAPRKGERKTGRKIQNSQGFSHFSKTSFINNWRFFK